MGPFAAVALAVSKAVTSRGKTAPRSCLILVFILLMKAKFQMEDRSAKFDFLQARAWVNEKHPKGWDSEQEARPGGGVLLCRSADVRGEPGAGVDPITSGGGAGNTEHFGGFFKGQANEIAELDQFCFLLVRCGQLFEDFVDGQNLILVLSHRDVRHLDSF